MQRFLPHRRIADVSALGVDVHAVLDRRRAKHAEFSRQVVGEALDDDRIAAEWKMRTVLLTGADRHNETRILR